MSLRQISLDDFLGEVDRYVCAGPPCPGVLIEDPHDPRLCEACRQALLRVSSGTDAIRDQRHGGGSQ